MTPERKKKKEEFDAEVGKKITQSALKKSGKTKPEDKPWVSEGSNGDTVTLKPTFAYDVKQDTTDCHQVSITIGGKTVEIDFMDLYMFTYYVASEEFRTTMANRYDREVKYIPYELDFVLDAKEKKEGKAVRLVNLPLDEVYWYIAKQEAHKILNGAKPEEIVSEVYKPKYKD